MIARLAPCLLLAVGMNLWTPTPVVAQSNPESMQAQLAQLHAQVAALMLQSFGSEVNALTIDAELNSIMRQAHGSV
jgi:hypothetical protein